MKTNPLLNLIKSLFPSLRKGALSISDSDLRLVLFEKNRLLGISVRLPKGTMLNGKIQNESNLLLALKHLHSSLINTQKKIELVVCLSPQSVYNYYFTVPSLSKEDISHAASLNLRMKSPYPYEETYCDWQIIESGDEQVRMMGAYVDKETVIKLSHLLYQANFLPIAFEFQGLALARLLRDFDRELIKIPFLLLYFSNQGINLSFIKNGELYFDYFFAWEKKQFELQKLEEIIKEEIYKVLSFCKINLGESFSKVILISPFKELKIDEFIKKEVGMETIAYRLKGYDISPFWYVSLGSLLRDTEEVNHCLNLSGQELEDEIRKERVINLGIVWRDVFVSFLSFFLLVFLSFDFFLFRYGQNLKNQLQSISLPKQLKEVEDLKAKAKEFNNLVSAVSQAQKRKSHYGDTISKIVDLAKGKIVLNHLYISGNSIRIQGKTSSEEEIIAFKNRLISSNFKEIDLPLPEIKAIKGGVKFVLTCKISQ